MITKKNKNKKEIQLKAFKKEILLKIEKEKTI